MRTETFDNELYANLSTLGGNSEPKSTDGWFLQEDNSDQEPKSTDGWFLQEGNSDQKPKITDSKSSKSEFCQPLSSTIPSNKRLVNRKEEIVESNYSLLDKFEGYIVSIDEQEFVAKLRSTTYSSEDFESTFEVTDIPESQIKKLKIGASLIWTIGKSISGRTIEKKSKIYLPNLPMRSKADVDSAKKAIAHKIENIDWE